MIGNGQLLQFAVVCHALSSCDDFFRFHNRLRGNALALSFPFYEFTWHAPCVVHLLRTIAMKIAIPVWHDRVSSAFDFAQSLLLVDIEHGRETGREEIPWLPESIPEMKTLGVKVLICGAISRSLASQVKACGVKVLPYVVGQVDEILKAYLTGKLVQPQFALPGSWPGARKAFRRRH